MKKLSKLVALLLAGAMAMLLLTACGGNNISGENKPAEDAYIKAVNAQRGDKQALKNDNQELKRRANELLNTAVDFRTGQFTGKAKVKVETGWERTIITVVTKCTYNNTDLNEFLNSISFENQNVDVKFAGLWTDVGVVVRTIKGQTYIAVSVEISNPLVRQ